MATKSRRQLAHDHLVASEFSLAQATAIAEAIEIMIGPKKKGEKTEGGLVWERYEQLIIVRHGIRPLRNAMVNNQCSQLVARVGLETALALLEFYVKHPGGYYFAKKHPIGLCLKDAETLYAEMLSGKITTKQQAQRHESAAATLNASQQYLSRKHNDTR